MLQSVSPYACLVVANCVGYNNHKAFFLFVTYGAAYAYTVFLTVLPFAITAMADRASVSQQ